MKNTQLMFLALLVLPSLAFAGVPDAVSTASSGPWVPLLVVAVLRTLLCVGNGAGQASAG